MFFDSLDGTQSQCTRTVDRKVGKFAYCQHFYFGSKCTEIDADSCCCGLEEEKRQVPEVGLKGGDERERVERIGGRTQRLGRINLSVTMQLG